MLRRPGAPSRSSQQSAVSQNNLFGKLRFVREHPFVLRATAVAGVGDLNVVAPRGVSAQRAWSERQMRPCIRPEAVSSVRQRRRAHAIGVVDPVPESLSDGRSTRFERCDVGPHGLARGYAGTSEGTRTIFTVYVAQVMRAAAGEVRDVARAKTPTHGRLRDSLVVIAVVTGGIDLICGVVAFVLEHGAKQTQISSFGSAIFWTSTQLLTVSSSIQNPISVGGRILDVAMEAYAITVLASLAGSLGAYMVKRGRELEQAAEQERKRS